MRKRLLNESKTAFLKVLYRRGDGNYNLAYPLSKPEGEHQSSRSTPLILKGTEKRYIAANIESDSRNRGIVPALADEIKAIEILTLFMSTDAYR